MRHSPTPRRRNALTGYRDALRAAGIDAPAELVAEAAFDAASGHVAMAALLRADHVRRRLRGQRRRRLRGDRRPARGRPAGPGDVSVVGFDDIALAALLRPTPHHRPPAGLRARASRRTSAAGPDRRSAGPGSDAAADRAHRACLDGSVVDGFSERRGLTTPTTGDQEDGPDDRAGDPGKEKRHGGADIPADQVAGLLAAATIVAAACSSGTASSSPAASTAGERRHPPARGRRAEASPSAGGKIGGRGLGHRRHGPDPKRGVRLPRHGQAVRGADRRHGQVHGHP